jgi:hypothetical protein
MPRRDTLAHDSGSIEERQSTMSKKGRKKRNRKKSAANHGKRPNS